MSRFDSLDLVFDLDPLPIVDRGRCWATTAHETGQTVWVANARELGDVPGLSGIRDDGATVGVRVSAKLLGADYFDGFRYETVGTAADLLNGSGFFHGVRADDLLAARVTRADPFLDVPLGDGLSAYVEAMHLLTATGGRRFEAKGRRGTPTFYARPRGDLMPVRQYGKQADFGKAKNRAWGEAFPELPARAQAQGLWRVEGYAVGLRQLRQLAWVERGSPTLSEVLRCPGSPLADSIERDVSHWAARATRPMPLPSIPNNPAAAVDAFSGLSRRDVAAQLHDRWICDLAADDLAAAEGILRALYGPKNWGRYLDSVRAEIEARLAAGAVKRTPALADPDLSPLAAVRSTLADFAGTVRQLERAA